MLQLLYMDKGWVLITGGTSGIGLAFAKELAAVGGNLVLVSVDDDSEKVAIDLRKKFDVEVEIIRADLAKMDDVEIVRRRLTDAEKPVGVLINCAGFVLRDSLVHGDLARQRAAFAVMAEAILILSQTAADVMKKRGHGAIINVSSTSAWLFNGNYSAIKSWVVTYTKSLALELSDANLRVAVVCPGQTKTDFHKRGGVKSPKIPSWLLCTPKEVAHAGLLAAAKGKTIFVPTFKWRLFAFLCRHFRCFATSRSRKRVAEINVRDD